MSSYIYILFQITQIICSFSLISTNLTNFNFFITCVYMQFLFISFHFIIIIIIWFIYLFLPKLKYFVQMISD